MSRRVQAEIGKLIGLARELKGWTLRDLEKQSGVSNALINQIETGHVKEPGFHTTTNLCEVLGISPERAFKAAYQERLLRVTRARTALPPKPDKKLV